MKTVYTPSALAKAAAQVRTAHPNSSEIKEYTPDKSFLNQVRYWSQLPEEEVEGEAITIPIRQIRLLARYLPENQLQVPLKNLTRIVYLRANEEIVRTLYMLWLDYFSNKDFCALLHKLILDKPKLAHKITPYTELDANTLRKWLESQDIPFSVGKECIRLQHIQRIHFAERLMSVGVLPSSKLGQKCIAEYLTYCERVDYLQLSDSDLLQSLKRCAPDTIKRFLKNVLTELKVEDFDRYYQSGSFVRNAFTGDAGTQKYKQYFSGFTPEQELKYRRWLNYILIRDSFGKDTDDERLVFWSRYVPYSVNAYRVRSSESLVIEFAAYCVIEFTLETMGPIYFYRKDVFDDSVKLRLYTRNNSDLRNFLLHESDYAERIVHNGDWQWRTRYYLTEHNVTQ